MKGAAHAAPFVFTSGIALVYVRVSDGKADDAQYISAGPLGLCADWSSSRPPSRWPARCHFRARRHVPHRRLPRRRPRRRRPPRLIARPRRPASISPASRLYRHRRRPLSGRSPTRSASFVRATRVKHGWSGRYQHQLPCPRSRLSPLTKDGCSAGDPRLHSAWRKASSCGIRATARHPGV